MQKQGNRASTTTTRDGCPFFDLQHPYDTPQYIKNNNMISNTVYKVIHSLIILQQDRMIFGVLQPKILIE